MKRQVLFRTIAYGAVLVFFTLLFTFVNYPSHRLSGHVNSWLDSSTEGAVSAGGARLKLPFYLVVSNITWQDGGSGSLDLGEAVIRPRVLALFSGRKAADLKLSNPWLHLSLRIVSSSENLDLLVRDAEIELSELPDDLSGIPLELEGKLKMSMKLLVESPPPGILNGDLTIDSGPIVISGDILNTLGISPLNIKRVSGVAAIKDNVATLGENGIEGDLNVVARGAIRLSPADPVASRLDLNVELVPAAGRHEQMRPIFSILGARTRADGSINIRIRGTVGSPSVTM